MYVPAQPQMMQQPMAMPPMAPAQQQMAPPSYAAPPVYASAVLVDPK
jgi:hypothetical protein